MADTCGGDILANQLLTSLIAGKTFDIPDVDLDDDIYQIPDETGDLYGNVVSLKTEDLTERKVNGSGVFDALMESVSVHLKKEYEQNRITGNDYTKAYIEITGGVLETATQFLLGRDQAYWQAILAQQQARAAELAVITARVQLQTAKAALAISRYQALTAEAEYGLTKMKIATEDANLCLIKEQVEQAQYTTANILPAQHAGLELDNDTKTYSLNYLMPIQKHLLEEQVEVQRAQTMDTRSDNATPVAGSVGKQKDLYTQQITSYQRDAEVKTAKLFTDAWITQKTIDEGLTAPAGFTNTSLDEILTALKVNNELI